MKVILITGGTGLIGRQLTKLLTENVIKFDGTPEKRTLMNQPLNFCRIGKIENEALIGADAIINLAGASISGERWTNNWKKEIYDRRIRSTEFLFEIISKQKHDIKAFISASVV